MTEPRADAQRNDSAETKGLDRLVHALGEAPLRGPAPVELWHPPYGGELDLHIAFDGAWLYGGQPIRRRSLVELFARILRRDETRFVLVTPAECFGITVADAPFVAAAMSFTGEDLRIRTNMGDEVAAGDDHPLRFELEPEGGVRPYVLVRGGLWARFSRSLAVELLLHAEPSDADDGLFIHTGGRSFALPPVAV